MVMMVLWRMKLAIINVSVGRLQEIMKAEIGKAKNRGRAVYNQ